MAGDDELAMTATAPHSGDVVSSAPATELGKYRLENQLGAGGMGVVYAAFDSDLERRVAVKLLHDEANTSSSRARLLREARAMAKLSHPNVVTVHEVGTINNRDFVAMELIDGQSLAEWLRGSPHKPVEIIDAFIAAGAGLAAAHAQGLVHRDFKPHNVLRSASGRVLVTDFGLARGVEDRGAIDPPTARASAASLPVLTATGVFVGTPAYMSPEQWSGDAVGPATDQFAFCVAFWEALAGERPFRGTTQEQLRDAVQRGPQNLDAKKIPRALRPLLFRGLDPDPTKRWPSMTAVLDEIARTRRRKKLLGSVAIAAATFVGLRLYMMTLSPSTKAPSVDPNVAALTVPAAKTHDELVATISRIAPDSYAIPRAAVEQIITERDRMFGDDVRFAQTADGYRLFGIRPVSIFSAFGFENGDLLTSVDGIAATPDKLVEIYRDIRAAKQVIVEWARKTDARTSHIEIR